MESNGAGDEKCKDMDVKHYILCQIANNEKVVPKGNRQHFYEILRQLMEDGIIYKIHHRKKDEANYGIYDKCIFGYKSLVDKAIEDPKDTKRLSDISEAIYSIDSPEPRSFYKNEPLVHLIFYKKLWDALEKYLDDTNVLPYYQMLVDHVFKDIETYKEDNVFFKGSPLCDSRVEWEKKLEGKILNALKDPNIKKKNYSYLLAILINIKKTVDDWLKTVESISNYVKNPDDELINQLCNRLIGAAMKEGQNDARLYTKAKIYSFIDKYNLAVINSSNSAFKAYLDKVLSKLYM